MDLITSAVWVLVEAGRTGMGMFVESYFLFAVGNINAIWQVQYPQCFTYNPSTLNITDNCNNAAEFSTTYVEGGFVIVGMLLFGYLADFLGRKIGSRTVASLMFIGGK